MTDTGGKDSAYSRIADKKGGAMLARDELRARLQLEGCERKEDWGFFALFIFILLDFVFFATLKVWLPVFGLCFIQATALGILRRKIGREVISHSVDNFLNRFKEEKAKRLERMALVSGKQQNGISSEEEDLTEQLAGIQLARGQDWFIFVAAVFLFLDVVFFSVFNNWADAIVLLILEVFALFVLGEKMDIKSVCALINRFVDLGANKIGADKLSKK